MKKLRFLILLVVCFCPIEAIAYPQSVFKRVLDDKDDRSLALIGAKAEYIYRLEKLLALQESDLKTNEDYLEENRPLLVQDKRFEMYLSAIEGLIKNNKEFIKSTRELLAKAELHSLTEDAIGDQSTDIKNLTIRQRYFESSNSIPCQKGK